MRGCAHGSAEVPAHAGGRSGVAANIARWLRRSSDHGPAIRVAREASRDRYDDAAQAQQGVEQRLVLDLPERPVPRAVQRGLPGPQEGLALLLVLRSRDDVRREATRRGRGLQILEAIDME